MTYGLHIRKYTRKLTNSTCSVSRIQVTYCTPPDLLLDQPLNLFVINLTVNLRVGHECKMRLFGIRQKVPLVVSNAQACKPTIEVSVAEHFPARLSQLRGHPSDGPFHVPI